jgi:hypothetical protein
LSDPAGEFRTAGQAGVGEEDIHRNLVQYRDGLSRVCGLEHLKPLASKICCRTNPFEDVALHDQHDRWCAAALLVLRHAHGALLHLHNLTHRRSQTQSVVAHI